jgi:hypothetical protein
LLAENKLLKEELKVLKGGVAATELPQQDEQVSLIEPFPINVITQPTVEPSTPTTTNRSESPEKIKLFMSLFKGRNDVYARRWENPKKGTCGYSPTCLNEWKPRVCSKPKVACSTCGHKAYAPLDGSVVDKHLRGSMVAGIYPMLPDETCWFLAVDFDDGDWQSDIAAVKDVCSALGIPCAVERSRSGNGGHLWFFFEAPVSAILARKFGSSLLTRAMNERHEITFKSYDRLFPNQDTMPKGGVGNLIALPLQKEARCAGNSSFIDENFEPYADQ